jgi:hypothetical protein
MSSDPHFKGNELEWEVEAKGNREWKKGSGEKRGMGRKGKGNGIGS